MSHPGFRGSCLLPRPAGETFEGTELAGSKPALGLQVSVPEKGRSAPSPYIPPPPCPPLRAGLDPLGTNSLRSFGSTGKWAVTCSPFFGQDPTAATVRTDPGIYIAVLVPDRTLSPNTSWYFQP